MSRTLRRRMCTVLTVAWLWGGTASRLAAQSRGGEFELQLDEGASGLFSSAALRDAISVRIASPDVPGPVKVSVNRESDERLVRISVGERRCEASLQDEQTSSEALRIVALLTADLIESGGVSRVIDVRPVHDWAIGGDGLVSPVGSWGDSRLEVSLTLKRRLTSTLWGVVGFAYGRSPGSPSGESTEPDSTVDLSVPQPESVIESVPVRLGIAKMMGSGEVVGAAVARFYRVGEARETVFGASLEFRPELVRGSLGRVTAILALEAATERVEVQLPGRDTAFASGYLTPWLGLGVASP